MVVVLDIHLCDTLSTAPCDSHELGIPSSVSTFMFVFTAPNLVARFSHRSRKKGEVSPLATLVSNLSG